MYKKIGLIVGSFLIMSSAYAEQFWVPSGFYTRLSGGMNFMPSVTPTETFHYVDASTPIFSNNNFYDATTKFTFEPGWQGDIAFGYRFSNSFRIEGAWGYVGTPMSARYTYQNSLSGQPDGIQSPNQLNNGWVHATTYMVNGYYDLPTATAVSPYIGIGLGYMSRDYYFQTKGDATVGTYYEWTLNEFATQGIAGLRVDVASGFSVTMDYRFLYSPEQTGTYTSTNNVLTGSSDFSYVNNLVSIGVMYLFA